MLKIFPNTFSCVVALLFLVLASCGTHPQSESLTFSDGQGQKFSVAPQGNWALGVNVFESRWDEGVDVVPRTVITARNDSDSSLAVTGHGPTALLLNKAGLWRLSTASGDTANIQVKEMETAPFKQTASGKFWIGFTTDSEFKYGINKVRFALFQHSGNSIEPLDNGVQVSFYPWMQMGDYGHSSNFNEQPSPGLLSNIYSARMAFSMAGEWQIRMFIEDEGEKVDSVYFSVDIAPK